MLDCSTRHANAYLVENYKRVKPVVIRMQERCSTLVAAADDDEGDGEGTEVKLISSALPVACSEVLPVIDWFSRYDQQGKTEGFRSCGIRRPCRWASGCSANLLSLLNASGLMQ